MMNDQCRYCQLRGKLKECQETDCGHHDNWINQQLRAENAEAKMIIRWVLDWVDAVPSGTQLPTMPGFDRDYVENFLSGEVE